MSLEDDNIALLRRAYRDWQDTKGDAQVWLPILAEHVAWGSAADGRPGLEFTKPRASREEVVEYFEGLSRDWQMEFYHINEYVAQGARVVAIGECSWTNRNTGKTVTMPKVDIWLVEDGKVTQFMEHYDTYTAIMATRE